MDKPKDMRCYVSVNRHRISFDQVSAWIRASFWGKWQTEAQVAKALQNSTVFGLYILKRGEIEPIFGGFARVVSDNASVSVISDVYIDEPYRGMGFGRSLMEAVIAHPSVSRTICILATRDKIDFYAKFGFGPMVGNALQRSPTK